MRLWVRQHITSNIMTNKTSYWDSETNQQLERDCTPEEVAEIELRKLPQPTPIPQSVTMRQARLALLAAGKLASVTAAINALPSPQKEAAQIEWEYSQTVERNRGFVLLLGAALGLTDAQLDGLFLTAAGL
jgi:hypothetical protein